MINLCCLDDLYHNEEAYGGTDSHANFRLGMRIFGAFSESRDVELGTWNMLYRAS